MTPPNEHDRTTQDPITDPLTDPLPPAFFPAADAASFSQRTARPSRLRLGAVAGAAVALAVGAVATSFAASPATSPAAVTTSPGTGRIAPGAALPATDGGAASLDHGRSGGPGGFRDITVGAISGNNITLKTDDGWSRTIAVTSTVALTKGGQTIALGDIAVRDQVRFSQTLNADGTYAVKAIAVVVPSVAGTVSNVGATSFKVRTRDGSVWTITTDGATTYRLGAVDGTRANVTNGSTVRVEGTSSGDNALSALGVRVAAGRIVGSVTAKTASTITITTRDGTSVAVKVDGSTTYLVAGKDPAALADITVDMVVGVQGTTNSDGSIDATAVVAGGRVGGHGRLPGMMGDGPGMGRGRFDGPGGSGGPAGPG